MNHLLWLVRAKRWVQNPPSEARVRLVLGVIALCLIIAGYEWAFGWPEWLTVNSMSQKP
jgi:predicted acyltransferase